MFIYVIFSCSTVKNLYVFSYSILVGHPELEKEHFEYILARMLIVYLDVF